jgi:hypothetical protein
MLKSPADLDEDQVATLRRLKRQKGTLWRAYSLIKPSNATYRTSEPVFLAGSHMYT